VSANPAENKRPAQTCLYRAL